MRVREDGGGVVRHSRAPSGGVYALRNALWMWGARGLCGKCRGVRAPSKSVGPKMMAIRRLQNLWSGYGSYPFFTDL